MNTDLFVQYVRLKLCIFILYYSIMYHDEDIRTVYHFSKPDSSYMESAPLIISLQSYTGSYFKHSYSNLIH